MDFANEPTPQEAAALQAGKKKKKATKMSLGEFQTGSEAATAAAADPGALPPLGNISQRSTSWADETPEPMLPTGPSSHQDTRYDSPSSSTRDIREPRSSRPAPPQHDLPTSPPFTAYVGNLPFNAAEDDIRHFFDGCKIKQVRILLDRETRRPKGFCYVEFADVDSLARALGASGRQLNDRTLRVDVAQPNNDRGHRGGGDDDRTSGNWRENRPERFGGGDRDRDRDRDREYDRDRRPPRDSEPSRSDTTDSWRRQEPLPPQSQRERHHSRNDDRPPRGDDRPLRGGAFDREHRDSRHTGGLNPDGGEPKAVPTERQKLVLKPRTVDTPPASLKDELADDYVAKTKANPFGAAKPRDENEIMRKKDEEHKKREEERKQKEEAEKAERAIEKAAEGVSTGESAAKPTQTESNNTPTDSDKRKSSDGRRERERDRPRSQRAPGDNSRSDGDWHDKSDKSGPRAFNNDRRDDRRREGGGTRDRREDRGQRSGERYSDVRRDQGSRPSKPMPQVAEPAEPAKVVNQFEVLSTDE